MVVELTTDQGGKESLCRHYIPRVVEGWWWNWGFPLTNERRFEPISVRGWTAAAGDDGQTKEKPCSARTGENDAWQPNLGH